MILIGYPRTFWHVETLSDGCGFALLKMVDGDLRMNKEADLENVPREPIASLLSSCLYWVIPLAGCMFALACGTPPRPAVSGHAVSAGELLLLDREGQPVDVGEPMWEDALYYHENNISTPYTGPIEASYTNGNKRMLAFVRKGRLDGSSIIWFENGAKEQFNIIYQSGDVDAFKEYDENGTLLAEYPKPPPVSVGSTNASPTSPGTNDVKMSLLELRGALIYHVDEMIFAFTGTAIEQWPDGTLKKREIFLDGEHHGSVKWWHKNRKPWYSATYKSGLPEGKVEAWRPDGTREYIYTWEDGFPSSKVSYAPDDTESGRVMNDSGTLIYFHPNGKKKLEEVYEGNILAPAKQIWYDENGLQIDPPPNPPGIPSPSN